VSSNDDELKDILDQLGEEEAAVENSKEDVVILDDDEVAKTSLKKSKDKFKKKLSTIYNSSGDKATKEKYKKRLETYDSEIEVDRGMVRMEKITPDIERILFPYFMAGATLRSIHQQFGTKFNFGMQSLYKARDFYLWEDRKKAITSIVVSEQGAEIASRMNDYLSFFDDLMSEAIIRFKKNSMDGRNSNPFETLKVQNVKDLKDLTELMLNIVGKQEETRGRKAAEKGNEELEMSDKKAAKLLEVLAEDDDE